MSLELEFENNNKVIFKYYKQQYGAVGINYACKVLEVSKEKFRKIKKEYNLRELIVRSPNLSFDIKLYYVSDLRDLKEKLKQNDNNNISE